jgi:hypothetical protein
MLLVIGVVMVVLGAIYGALIAAAAALVFVLAGGQQYRVVLMHTASQLTLDPSVHWLEQLLLVW